MSPGCRAEGGVVRDSRTPGRRAPSHRAGDTQEGPRDNCQPAVHRHIHTLTAGTCRWALVQRKVFLDVTKLEVRRADHGG